MKTLAVVADDGTRLAGRVDGPADPPTVILANSLGTDLRMWDPQVADLTPRLRVIRFDARGQGASDVPAGPYTIERLAFLTGRPAARTLRAR